MMTWDSVSSTKVSAWTRRGVDSSGSLCTSKTLHGSATVYRTHYDRDGGFDIGCPGSSA